MASNVVTDNTFQEKVIEASKEKPVLVDFWATWCGPCKMLSPLVEELAGEKSEQLNVAKIDVDENQAVSSQFGIMSIPTLILFKDGKPVKQMVGYMPKARLLSQIEGYL
ncbi:MAG: thioredoxin [Chloroflexi bacterium]|nr:thioredoxin [Chloroflexota bacterium]OJV93669.1 MAG: thioredoxin [Chloroflexi bacterium 54-19]